MSNEMTLFKDGNKLPSYLKNREMDAVTKSLMGGGSLAKRISIKGGVWRLMSGGKEIAVNEDRAMNFIIVNAAAKVGRTYYEGTYDPDAEKASAPVCWSANGETPDASVEAPQSKTCATCPQNIKGSGQAHSRPSRPTQRPAPPMAKPPTRPMPGSACSAITSKAETCALPARSSEACSWS